ncbi:MAG TPA: glycosyltransferase [Pyrinomonadaceae bacterium]
MKIGIYSSCLNNALAANVSLSVLATILARQHEIEIIRLKESTVKTSIEGTFPIRAVERPPQIVTDPNSPDRRYQALRDWSNELTRPYDLFINLADRLPVYCAAPRGVLLIQSPHDFMPVIYGSLWQAHLDSYQLKLANSYYTRFWTKVFWETDCEVLYPPVPSLNPSHKDQSIVLSGRFNAVEGDSELKLISIFKELKPELAEWSLTIIGDLYENRASQRSFAAVDKAAKEAGVSVFANPTYDELRSLLQRAKLLWQADGWNDDPERRPEDSEGFSLKVAQAMSAGCVPQVPNCGGLPELIKHEQNGFFWRDPRELKNHTLMLSRDEGKRLRLVKAARKRAHDFRPERFNEGFLNHLESAFGIRSYSSANPAWLWRRFIARNPARRVFR